MRYIALIGLLSLQTAECQKQSAETSANGLIGTWRLYEQTRSGPDDRPVRTTVPASPEQVLTLSASGQVRVEGEQLANLRSYTAYRVDSTQAFMDYKNRLVFLPEPADADPYANFIQLDGDTLHLVRPGRGASRSTFVREK